MLKYELIYVSIICWCNRNWKRKAVAKVSWWLLVQIIACEMDDSKALLGVISVHQTECLM